MSVSPFPMATIFWSGLGHLLEKESFSSNLFSTTTQWLQWQMVFLEQGNISLGTPGFTHLVTLVIEGSLWTWSARTCAHNHSVDLPLNLNCKSNVYVLKSWAYFLLTFLWFITFVTLFDTERTAVITTDESFSTATLCVSCGSAHFHIDLST